MERRRLGSTGLSVPAVGVGTRRASPSSGRSPHAARATIEEALRVGADLFDTSPMFGDAERLLADHLAGRRERALVASKMWARTRAVGEDQIEHSLAWFGHLDLYFVHNLLAFRDHYPLLERLTGEGKIAALGGSHYLPTALSSLAELVGEGAISVVECPYHPLERGAEEALLDAAAERDAGVLVMRPFGGGALLERPPGADALAPLADFGIRTWPQAILKWILSDTRVHGVITGASGPEQIRESAAAGEPPWLGEGERRYVAELAAKAKR